MTRPTVALSMLPRAGADALPARAPGAARRGRPTCSTPEAIRPPADRADEVLAAADVLLGHWGCALLDDAFLAGPRLRMLAYAAGTLRDVATPAAFARLERVTSGAAANAVPVAEYTVGAILWANKAAFTERERLRGAEPTAAPSPPPGRNWAKRIGLVGASHVGRAVIALLAPYRCEVVVADPYLSDEGAAAWAWPGSSSTSCWPPATSSACTPRPARDRADDRRRRSWPR